MLAEQIENLQVDDIKKIELRIEYEKVRIEQFKARWTVVSIFVPLLIGIGAVVFNMILQDRRAKTDFEIKAAEIVMTADSPAAATHKAAVLVDLFPDRLPRRFKETFEKFYGSPDQSERQ